MEEKQNNPLFSEQEQLPKDAHQAQKNGTNTGHPDTGSTPVRPTHVSGIRTWIQSDAGCTDAKQQW